MSIRSTGIWTVVPDHSSWSCQDCLALATACAETPELPPPSQPILDPITATAIATTAQSARRTRNIASLFIACTSSASRAGGSRPHGGIGLRRGRLEGAPGDGAAARDWEREGSARAGRRDAESHVSPGTIDVVGRLTQVSPGKLDVPGLIDPRSHGGQYRGLREACPPPSSNRGFPRSPAPASSSP